MNKVLGLMLIGVLILGLSTGCGKSAEDDLFARAKELIAQGIEITDLSYKYYSENPYGSVQGHTWSKGKRSKTETTVMGSEMVLYLDFSIGEGWTYYPANQVLEDMDSNFVKSLDGQKPTDFAATIDISKVETVENVTLRDTDCLLVTTDDGIMAWIRLEDGLLIQFDGNGTRIEFTEIEVAPIDEEVITPPAG